MTSKEYVENLKREYPNRKYGNESDLLIRTISHLGERIPNFIRHKLENGTISVGEIGVDKSSAYVKEVSEDDFAIIFHSGLSEFAYRVIRAVSTRCNYSNAEELVSFDDAIRIVSEIFWWYQETEKSFGPDYKIHEHQKEFASLITTEVESFFLAHEFAHIIIPKKSKLTPNKLIERLAFGEYKGAIEDNSPHLAEYSSDLVAASIVLGIYNDNIDPNMLINQIRYAGIEAGLLIYAGLEELGFMFSESHPSFRDRITNIRENIRYWTNDDEQYFSLISLATSLEQLFFKIIETITSPSQKQISYYDESASNILNGLEDLLNKNTVSIDTKPKEDVQIKVQLENGKVVEMPLHDPILFDNSITPKYGEFYWEAAPILNQGYSHLVFQKMAEQFKLKIKLPEQDLVRLEFHLNLLTREEQIQFLTTNIELYTQLKEFQKIKLIVGYFSRQANPAGEYFFGEIFN